MFIKATLIGPGGGYKTIPIIGQEVMNLRGSCGGQEAKGVRREVVEMIKIQCSHIEEFLKD